MDVYKSKIDKWLLICLILSMVACLLGASVMLKIGGTLNYAIATFIVVAGAGFPLWILVSTKYIVERENLQIISGPFSWNIPIQSIESIHETQNAITSPALSFNRLEIKYGEDKIIIVSPVNKEEFMRKLSKEKSPSNDKNNRQKITEKAQKNSAIRNKKHRKKA